MASEETGLVQSHSQLLFQDDSNSGFRCNPPNHHQRRRPDHQPDGHNGKTTRELTGFIDHQNRYYQPQGTTELRRSIYDAGTDNGRGVQSFGGGNGRSSNSPSGDGSDGDDEDDDDVDELVISGDNKNHLSSNTSEIGEKTRNGETVDLPCFGSREVMKEGNNMVSRNDLKDARASASENHQQGRENEFQNAVTIADPDGELYYSQYLQGTDCGAGIKDMVVENGCGFSGRKDISYLGEPRESLRAILSDPLTGALMDDAMILPCGHSFGSGGMQHVMKMKTCYTCSHPISEGSVASNLSLRSAVLAYRREEELQGHHAYKRRRERFEQETNNYGDSMFMDQSRRRGLQFPFSVADRVIIKGNKRTPERFVGCEAVVTTQCLNGWYVVKTLDNAESVKLQYRSLAKVSDNSSSKPASGKMTPNWL